MHTILMYASIYMINGTNIISVNKFSQDTLNNKNKTLKNTDHIYKDYIKTILLYREGEERSYPIIQLNSNDKLFLSFDDLQAGVKNYKYTVIHCNSEWEESDLQPIEYLEGYQTDLIENYNTSIGTDIPYTHYELVFPTRYLQITKSGNYLLKVFSKTLSDENIAFTSRFMIVDPKVDIEGKINRAFPQAENAGFSQSIEFTIYTNRINIINPFVNLKIVITQNRRWDNANNNLEPTSVYGNKIEYNPMRGNIFNSGNEYRSFDIKDLRHRTENIKLVENTYQGYEVTLKSDNKRSTKEYITIEDLNGRRLIRTEKGRDPATEADYVYTKFFLPYPYPIGFGDLYILGELTNWQLNNTGKMNYNFNRNGYEKTLLLKQGYYEYVYAFLDNKKSCGDITLVEGNHFDTNNEYMIYVYYHDPGKTYQQLIGVKLLKSHVK